ncbi:hypothetical protein BKA62DRAFT_753147 [Auriculariales sp. MPI-PUGE-AT-0066]|nr:hypothetical protein BKA62DRAFT_753147 [Auriculariales sp. MPI-PUGE-AT-0066]
MSDTGRQSFTDKVGAAVKPDSHNQTTRMFRTGTCRYSEHGPFAPGMFPCEEQAGFSFHTGPTCNEPEPGRKQSGYREAVYPAYTNRGAVTEHKGSEQGMSLALASHGAQELMDR